MRFCPNCDNLLVPKSKRLYCKICKVYFNLDINIDEYKIIQTIKHNINESTIILKEGVKQDKVTSNDRKAFEDYFQIT